MAEITLSVPNSQVPRLVDALCTVGGYDGDPKDQPARREFARQVVCDILRRTVLRVEREQAAAMVMADVSIEPITVD